MKTSFLSVAVVLIAALSACNTARYAYSPSAHNVPVITQKGDGKVGAFYSTNLVGEERQNGETVDNRTRGFDLQGAYAVTDNFAVQASYFYRWEKTRRNSDSSTIRYNRNLTELGLGYYLPLNDKKRAFFQVFAGAGLGKFSFTDVDITGSYFHQANITKVYVQPAFLYRSKGSFTSSISLRASIINYSRIKTNYSYSQIHDYDLDSLNNRSKIFFEPAFTGSFGLKGVPGLRFEFQAGLSLLASTKFMNYRFIDLSVGTWLNLGDFLRKK